MARRIQRHDCPGRGSIRGVLANLNAKVKYYGSVFDSSRNDARQWVPAFSKYLH